MWFVKDPESENEEKILEQIDKNILGKMEKGDYNLSDEEKQRLNTILGIDQLSNSVISNEIHEIFNFLIIVGLIVFSMFAIFEFNSNAAVIAVASTAIGGVIGYLVPNIKKTS